jgi:Ring hydroxylating alpha subunit (catalytic domain)
MVMFLRQDFANIPRQQIGMHSKAINSTLLNGVQEEIIANMHRALDRVLER